MLFTADHEEARRALQKFIAAEINPFVDEWEKADIFPAHELFKKLGDLGFLGLNKPIEFGGPGARLQLRADDGGRAWRDPLRRRADGDRRADRHGDAGAGAVSAPTKCAANF